MPFVAYAVAAIAGLAPARAADSISEDFKEFMVAGCIESFETGISVDVYAQGLGLAQANAQLAAAFLRGRPGSAYIKATRRTVLLISGTNESCTVATRVAPDLPGLVQAVEIGLATLKSPFRLVAEEQKPLLGGGTGATRTYDGTIGSRAYGVLLSTTEHGVPQGTVTVYPKGR